MSRPPASTSTGTFGSGPGASVAPPEGEGQSTQPKAEPVWRAQVPNGAIDAGEIAASAAASAARRASGVSFGCQGKGPSAQLVVRRSAMLMSLSFVAVEMASRNTSRSSGSSRPAIAASTAAGSSEEIGGAEIALVGEREHRLAVDHDGEGAEVRPEVKGGGDGARLEGVRELLRTGCRFRLRSRGMRSSVQMPFDRPRDRVQRLNARACPCPASTSESSRSRST